MTDTGRQGVADKLESNLKPESQKSTLEQVTDQAKSAYESVAGAAQPSDQKSLGQQATDAVSGDGQQGKSYLAQAQEGIANAASTASQTISDTINSVTGNSGSGAPK